VDNLVIDDVQLAEQEVLAFKKAGGDTIVDLTSIGLGRDPVALRGISRATGVKVVCGCGYYYHDTHPADMGKKTVEDIRNEIVIDLTVGIDGTGIKAGVIGEIGLSAEIHPDEEKVLKAAAQAQVETGAGIQVHVYPWAKGGAWPLGLEALGILENAGANVGKVCIGHADVSMDIQLDYCEEIARRGAYVGFDNFGHEFYVNKPDRLFSPGTFATDIQRVKALTHLLDAGYLRNILISVDVCHKCLLHKYGGWGYDHILTNIVPMMLEEGITQQQIDVLMKNNPRLFLDDRKPS
jgi:phosphotriesterase-related protein